MNTYDQIPFLPPKVRPPRLLKGLVHRDRLENCVDALENHLLIMVNAPSGFGKTILGAIWARELGRRSSVVSWLTLDQEDNDPSRFLQYLGYSITSACHDLPDGQHDGSALPFSPLKSREYIGQLVNYIAEIGDEFYVFLDDFQALAKPEINAHIEFLLQNAPSNFHLVLLSRAEKTRLTISKSMVPLEINASDLCFTVGETAALFERYPGRTAQAARAHAATGGWAAALRILAVSKTDILDSALTGKGELLSQQSFAQLLDTVLSHLTPREISLIEMTSIVVRMCAPLFNELTGTSEGRHLIERAEYTNALIARTTDDGYWVGCHDLVRQAMLARLAEKNPALIDDIADRASQWYAQQGYWSEAVTQAIAIGNRKLALKWIETCAGKFVQTGDVLVLLAWDRALNLSGNSDTPDSIVLELGFAQVLGADRESRIKLAALIKAKLAEKGGTASKEMYWGWLALQGIFACRSDEFDVARDVAERGLKFPPLYAHAVIEVYKNTAGYCYLHFREWDKFYALPQVQREGVTADSLLAATYRFLLFGLAEITQANFSRAQRYLSDAYQEACKGLGSSSLPSSLPGALLAFIHYEKLELDRAEHLLSEHLDVTVGSGYVDVISRAFIAASRIARLRKNAAGALELLEQFEKLARDSDQARLQLICAYEKMQFFLAEEKQTQANACLSRFMDIYRTSFEAKGKLLPEVRNYVGLAQGQHAMSQGRFTDAEAVLEQTYLNATASNDVYGLIASGTALAISQCHNRKNHEALLNFEKVLGPAEAAGMKASILYQASSIHPLLLLYQKNALHDPKAWRHLNFVESLLGNGSMGKEGSLVRLTPREKDILELIARGMSNKEISHALNITSETVKGYLKSVFIKFDVNKRAAAVTRARSMGLL